MIRQGGGIPGSGHAAARAHGAAREQAAAATQAGLAHPAILQTECQPARTSLEHDVLDLWERTGLHGRRERAMADRPAWICYESPPLGGGMPGPHHIPGRAVADLYLRFMAMRGFRVTRRTLLSCHGLPVEVAVESELGLSGATAIEDYGASRFAGRCRESVLRHADAFAALDARLGCWPASYAARTMDKDYIETVWQALSGTFHAGLLVRDDRIVPYCPRCRTPLSAQELGQPGVQRAKPGSDLVVGFRLTSAVAHPRLRGADLLAIVSAPWTLTANVAIAVHPHETYAIARRAGHDERVVVAEARLRKVLGEDWHVAARVTGAELAGARYAAPLAAPGDPAEREVVTSYFVSVRTGTGLQLLAPALAVQDREAAAAHGLPAPDPLGPDGRFAPGQPAVGGMFYTDADRVLADLLADRGLVFSVHRHERSRPHCWRCGAPVLLRAWPAWHIRVSAIGSRLGAAAEHVSWQPPLGGDERLHGWLRGEADWTVSRSRYWGTPLPIWECEHGHQAFAGSLGELSELAGQDLTGMDPHRPELDAVTIRCPDCGKDARRVPEVLDVWFDSGALPAAAEVAEVADLVVETADHAGAWCFALAAVGALTGSQAPFKAAMRTGRVLDAGGRPMSRQAGNLADPLPLIERHGADAVRWFFAFGAAPGAPRTLSDAALAEISDGVLAAYLDMARTFARCARAAAARGNPWSQGSAHLVPADARPLPDRWLLNELKCLVRDVTSALADFEPATAGRRIADFSSLVQRWYLPRSASRLWQGPVADDGVAAFATLQECLHVLSRLLAPVAPFLTDHVWSMLLPWMAGAPDSVHLASWPALTDDYSELLAAELSLVRRIGSLGAAARAAAGLKAGQPLALGRVLFRGGSTHAVADGTADGCSDPAIHAELAQALNVRSLEVLASSPGDVGEVPAPNLLGPGWAVASQDGELVELDVTIGADLASEGLAFDVISAVRAARNAADSGGQDGEPTGMWWRTNRANLARALNDHAAMVASELHLAWCKQLPADQLADQLADQPGSAGESVAPGATEHVVQALGLTVWLDGYG